MVWNELYLRRAITIPGGKELDLRWRNASARADCISRLRESDKLEEAAHTVLKHLGEVKRPYLTAVEENLLSLIERKYGVNNSCLKRHKGCCETELGLENAL